MRRLEEANGRLEHQVEKGKQLTQAVDVGAEGLEKKLVRRAAQRQSAALPPSLAAPQAAGIACGTRRQPAAHTWLGAAAPAGGGWCLSWSPRPPGRHRPVQEEIEGKIVQRDARIAELESELQETK